ncbi:MAG: class I SAM-dependent methyltransferase [Vicinamibacterales bacterium]
MIGLFLRLLKGGRTRAMDPLQVSMTGVRMGERFLQIGCHDRSLLAGLAAKVGLSGAGAVATTDPESARRAAAVGSKVGALIDVRSIEGPGLPFDSDQFDLIVIDDTNGSFAAIDNATRLQLLRDAIRIVRKGGRVEIVEGLGGGMLRGAVTRPQGYDMLRDLAAAGFKPVRELAEKDGFRFLEGLRPNS